MRLEEIAISKSENRENRENEKCTQGTDQIWIYSYQKDIGMGLAIFVKNYIYMFIYYIYMFILYIYKCLGFFDAIHLKNLISSFSMNNMISTLILAYILSWSFHSVYF